MTAMPFDLRPLTLPATARPATDDARPLAFWLLGVAGLVWIMVAIGGATRLTGSGLFKQAKPLAFEVG